VRRHADRLSEARRDGPGQPDGAEHSAADAGGRHPGAVREQLLRRLSELPPGHPSAPPEKKRSGESPHEAAGQADDVGSADRPRDDGVADGNALAGSDESDGPRPPDDGDGGFWGKVRHFQELWRAHVERWPEKEDREAVPDRGDDPPGSWRGIGGRYLSPKENQEADEQIDELRKPEEAVTAMLTRIQDQNPHGGLLAGLDHRLKGTERLKEKIADKMRFKDLDSPADAAAMIDDAVRYTFCFDGASYVAGHDYVEGGLEEAGYQLIYRRNHWINDQYKGINSRWQTPEGARFELQSHTRESYFAKEQLTHSSYERLRSPDTDWDEIPELEEFQGVVSSCVPRPDGAELIPDRRGDSR
jgi:hypothetical protein